MIREAGPPRVNYLKHDFSLTYFFFFLSEESRADY